MPSIHEMLTYRRPAGSGTERAFIARFIEPVTGAYQETNRNWIVVTDPESTVLFSCHTDTVHREEGYQTIRNTDGILRLSKRARSIGSNCLGADDTAGCWIMLELIAAGIPGTYVFHFGEERGGIGSSALALRYPDWLKRFTHAIAFDRRGTADVITHQAGGRCASDAFADAFAGRLHDAGLPGYRSSPDGIFTDTANYTDLIGECTNVSVGYQFEHSTSECLDLDHLFRLRDALVRMNWSDLPCKREPGESDPDYGFGWWRSAAWSKHDDDTRTTTPGRDNDPIILCLACGEEFGIGEDVCPACGEDHDFDTVEPDTRSVYLDPVYEQVQRDLDAALAKWRRDRDQ